MSLSVFKRIGGENIRKRLMSTVKTWPMMFLREDRPGSSI